MLIRRRTARLALASSATCPARSIRNASERLSHGALCERRETADYSVSLVSSREEEEREEM